MSGFCFLKSTFLNLALSSWLRKVGFRLGSAIKNRGLFSKIPIDFKIETRDF